MTVAMSQRLRTLEKQVSVRRRAAHFSDERTNAQRVVRLREALALYEVLARKTGPTNGGDASVSQPLLRRLLDFLENTETTP